MVVPLLDQVRFKDLIVIVTRVGVEREVGIKQRV